jgi:hypothetical protein
MEIWRSRSAGPQKKAKKDLTGLRGLNKVHGLVEHVLFWNHSLNGMEV